ncbi:ABC transporter permease [Cumulibacter soli]|uniref:ABC transporter permease n=1 Tax=Cumulibacter soli TaxID=2546344 RepID=UPI001419739F|nr:ABC transporter permease [Cumulibacter soli]
MSLVRTACWVAGVVVLAALLMHILIGLMPADAATIVAGPGADAARIERLRTDLGLDAGVLTQTADWLYAAARGDFGVSLMNGDQVSVMLGERIAVSAAVVIPAWLLTVSVGTALALIVAVDGSRRTRWVQVVAGGLSGVPEAIVATGLVLLLATWLDWLPPVSLIRPGDSVLDDPSLLILPIAALTLPATAWLLRALRGPAEDVAGRRYVAEARLRGRSASSVAARHVLPVLLPLIVQNAAVLAGAILAGSVVVEQIVALPGVGDLLSQAVAIRDIPVIQAVTVLVSAVVATGLACADALRRRLEVRR